MMPTPRALVVFTDQHEVSWLRWLTPGFRHCFVIVRDPQGEWIACDWLKGRFALRSYGPCSPVELEERLVACGHRVIAVAGGRASRTRALLRPMTCVEVAKQCLGITTLRPITPYGLFRLLSHESR